MTGTTSCPHKDTHKENVFIDLEDDGKMSYDVYEVCDDCNESWLIGDFEDDGKVLYEQMQGVF